MVDAVPKKKCKGSLSEEDICILMQKYSVTQVLVLLREMAQSADARIDWNALVKKTGTGIESAREYQMLWRYLAYRQSLVDKIEDGTQAQPLDDDSDLEFELEASPLVSLEVRTEAANCAKVLASGSPNESGFPSSSVAEGDMPNGHSSHNSAEHHHPSLPHSSNLILPASAQKQPPAGISSEVVDGNGAASIYPPRRKRKPWSEDEDLQLVSAVKKHGEGCWAAIAKGEFSGNRSAAQLSQRWGNLKKRPGSLSMGVNSSQLSEGHLATRHALQQALNNPLTAGCSAGNGASTSTTHVIASNKDLHVTNKAVPSQQQQLAQGTSNTSSVKPGPGPGPGPMGPPMSVPRSLPKKVLPKPSVTTESIQAVAVAAGARIASLSDAKSLFKAAQAKNTVHNFRGGSLITPSSTGSTTTSSLPPNVHFICTTPSTAGTPSCAPQTKGNTVKSSGPTVSVPQISRAKTVPTIALEQMKAESSSSGANELPHIEGKKSDDMSKISGTDTKQPVVDVWENNATALSSSRSLPKVRPEQDPSSTAGVNLCKKQRVDSQSAGNKDLTVRESKDGDSKETIVNQVPKYVDGNKKGHATLEGVGKSADTVTEKMEVSTEASGGTDKSDPMEL